MKHPDSPVGKWARAPLLAVLLGVPAAFVAGALAPADDPALFYQPVFFATAVLFLSASVANDVVTLRWMSGGGDVAVPHDERRLAVVLLSLRAAAAALFALAALWEGRSAFARFFEHVS